MVIPSWYLPVMRKKWTSFPKLIQGWDPECIENSFFRTIPPMNFNKSFTLRQSRKDSALESWYWKNLRWKIVRCPTSAHECTIDENPASRQSIEETRNGLLMPLMIPANGSNRGGCCDCLCTFAVRNGVISERYKGKLVFLPLQVGIFTSCSKFSRKLQ